MESLLLNQNNTTLVNGEQSLVGGFYARVSTGRQENEKTIESQIAEIKERVEKNRAALPPSNSFIDDGWSGDLLARPGLDALRDAIKNEELNVLYVYDLGRLSRDFFNQLLLIEEFKKAGVKLVSLHDINPENEEQVLHQRIMGLFHDYERKKIAERFRRGKLYKARMGIIINGQAKYGWDYIPRRGSVPPKIKVNKENARVVNMVWEWFALERNSVYQIIRRLYDLSIPPPKGKCEFWRKSSIDRMLRCDSYATGIIYYNKSEAVEPKNPIKNDKYKKVKKSSRKIRPKEEWIPFKVKPIVHDYGLYLKVKKRLEFYKKYANRKRKYDYLLTGLVECGCGKPRAGDGCSNNGHFYYRCAERIYRYPKKDRKCKIKAANAQILDKMIWRELVKYLTQPELIKKQAGKWLKAQASDDHDLREKRKLEELIAKVTKEEERYAKAYGAGTLEFDQLRELLRETKRRKKALEKQIEELNSKSREKALEIGIDELYKEAKRMLKSIDFTNKKQVVYDIIDKVIIKERRQVEVWAHIPLQIQLTSTEKVGYEPIGRNSWFAE